MPIAVIKFRLPQEAEEHRLALDGGKWSIVVWDLDQTCRNLLKHGHNFKNANEALQEVRNEIYKLMDASNLIFPE